MGSPPGNRPLLTSLAHDGSLTASHLNAPANPRLSTIVVACAADARYALPLAVMLNSIGSHVGPEVQVEAYVLDDGVGAADKLKVAASLPENMRLHWRQPAVALSGFPTWGRMPPTTYQKLTLGEWLPAELSRAIWLDCDLLVLEDLERLWRAEMTDFVALAIQDQRVPMVSSQFGVSAWRELGLPSESKYFNAGVLVIDLARWREQEVCRRALDYVRANASKIYFWDQEALNAVLVGKWGELDPRWNWHPSLDHLAARPDRRTSPDHWIIHFSGNLKPWNVSGGGSCHTLYRDFLDRTAWAGQRPSCRWQHGILRWYETSPLRRLLYPAERFATMAVRALTRKYTT